MPVVGKNAELPVAIVGGGFSGTLLAINLLRHGVKVALIERDHAQLAKGLAFGTRRPEHLLNVRASNMSAFPDDLGHFQRWMGYSTSDQANQFVPRLIYGHYLQDLLREAVAAAPDRAQVVAEEAVAARFDDHATTLLLAGGGAIACRALVLALGNFPPPPLPVLEGVPEGIYFPDPWQPGTTDNLDEVEHIVLLGTGLTAVDAVLSLDRAGYRGRITALSRRGLKPRSHAETGPATTPVPMPTVRGSWLVRAVRERAKQVDWRVAIDELRPHTQQIWRRNDTASQRRFLRHLRPYWDVHRHRLAPQVAKRIAELEEEGRLSFAGGKLTRAEVDAGAVRLHWRPRGEIAGMSVRAQRILNCIGPEGDITRANHPLLRNLLEQGRVRPDVHRMGLDVEQSGRLRSAVGSPQDNLFAVGPVTKGEAWEIVAVPDIRRQVWHLARYLGNAHWVEGEGL